MRKPIDYHAKYVGWQNIKTVRPPKHIGKFAVTNNPTALDAHGNMSHVWLAHMVHKDTASSTWFAYEDIGMGKVWDVTHWCLLPLCKP